MTKAQREILANYLADETAEIDQIYFLAGGNVSNQELTIVTYVGNERITETFAPDGHTETIHRVEVNR